MKELFDRVDENDRVIGVTTKDEAYQYGYVHRVSAIFVFTHDGKLLVQLRKDDHLLDHSAAGHVSKGESYDSAAMRELEEETGLKRQLEKIGVFYADERVPTRPEKQMVHYFGLYETMLTDEEYTKIRIQKDEVIALTPMVIPDIIGMMRKEPNKFTVGFQFTLNFYITKKGLGIPLVDIQ